jgi:hypothetical protein
LEAVLHRIDLYVDGEAQIEVAKQPKHGEYKVLRSEHGWVLAESDDPHAFASIYQAGFDRVVLLRPQDDKSLAITLAKKSDFIEGFPLFKMYDALCQLEPGWGGGSTIGGAPRNSDGSRSRLPLETIIETVDKTVLAELEAMAEAPERTTDIPPKPEPEAEAAPIPASKIKPVE